jgi:hypothetical protein
MILPLMLVALGSVLSGFGVVVFRRKVQHATLRRSNEVIGNYVMVVTALYGIFAAFVIVNLWEQQDEAERNTLTETNELHSLFRVARSLPEPQRGAIMKGTREYVASVLESEWPAMQTGDVHQIEIDYSHVDHIWTPLMGFEPKTGRDSALYSEAIRHCEEILAARRTRLLDSEKGLATYLWIILIAGAVINIVFMYMVGGEHVSAQAFFTGMSTALILLLIFTVADLRQPYRGAWRVTPEPYELMKERIEYVLKRENMAETPLAPDSQAPPDSLETPGQAK